MMSVFVACNCPVRKLRATTYGLAPASARARRRHGAHCRKGKETVNQRILPGPRQGQVEVGRRAALSCELLGNPSMIAGAFSTAAASPSCTKRPWSIVRRTLFPDRCGA